MWSAEWQSQLEDILRGWAVSGRRATHIEYDPVLIYVRRSTRPGIGYCLDLAAIDVCGEGERRKGYGRATVKACEHTVIEWPSLFQCAYVECVHNEHLREALERYGYLRAPNCQQSFYRRLA